ncbi:MAG TPA: hypothetical protein VIU40_10630 [Geobacteraceae bacterium]
MTGSGGKLTLTMLITGVPVAAMALAACVTGSRGECLMQARTIEVVLREHTRELMSLPGVVGTALGLCDGRPCIKVYVVTLMPDVEQKIPSALEGYPVSVEETGELRSLPRGGDSSR